MGSIRKQYPPSFKAKVALEAIKEERTSAKLASEHAVHPSQIKKWKKIAADGIMELFTDRRQRKDKEKALLIEELYREIGQLKVELDWLKKKCGLAREGEDYVYRPRK